MSEPWTCTQDHEASHIVIAWLYADRIDVIGDLYVVKEGGRRVAVAGVRPDPHFISPRNAAKVGVAGFLGEARGNVHRRRGDSQIVSDPGDLAREVMGTLTEFLCRVAPDEEAWRLHVDVRPEPETQRPVFTFDDVRNVGAWPSSSHPALMADLVAETIGDLHNDQNWRAILEIAAMIPDVDYASIPRRALRDTLSRLLPRDWK